MRFIELFIFLITFPIWIILIFVISIANLYLYKKIFFYQKRSGKNNKIFFIIKFITMSHDKQSYKKIKNFSKFLRKTKLDEIPQFINILKGEMTLVGPRPLYVEYYKLLSKNHKIRYTVKPGITGIVQLANEKNLTWKKKFDLDVWYVKNKCISLDLVIIFKTLKLIIFSFINSKSYSEKIMKKYKGN